MEEENTEKLVNEAEDTEAGNPDTFIGLIADNYVQMEKNLVGKLEFACQHPGSIGHFREQVWQELFEQLIPKKFSIAQSVFIIDSEGSISNEVDLAIFDEQYTPYIFKYGTLKYIPIEAVAVTIQCKSKSLKADVLTKWVESIKKLKTSLLSVARMHSYVAMGEIGLAKENGKFLNEFEEKDSKVAQAITTQTATRPLRILCYTSENERNSNNTADKLFDIIINPNTKKRLNIEIKANERTLSEWGDELNHSNPEKYGNLKKDTGAPLDTNLDQYKVKDHRKKSNEGNDTKKSVEEVSLLSLTFQLNQLLMLINNPLLFPHLAYVNMFKKGLQSELN